MQSIYIAGAGSGSGKSVVVLGFMELLSAINRRVGFFRPIVSRSVQEDNLTSLIRTRYDLPFPAEMLYGCTAQLASELVAGGHYDELLKLILSKYMLLDEKCDIVLCAGTDYDGLVPSLEFDFNADLANNFGCTIVVVVKGFGRSPEETLHAVTWPMSPCSTARRPARDHRQRRRPGHVEMIKRRPAPVLPETETLYVLPSRGAGKPTIGEIGQMLGGDCLCGEDDALNQVVTNYKVAAMEVPDFLNYIEDGCLIITPGDRSDIILASLAADVSASFRAWPAAADRRAEAGGERAAAAGGPAPHQGGDAERAHRTPSPRRWRAIGSSPPSCPATTARSPRRWACSSTCRDQGPAAAHRRASVRADDAADVRVRADPARQVRAQAHRAAGGHRRAHPARRRDPDPARRRRPDPARQSGEDPPAHRRARPEARRHPHHRPDHLAEARRVRGVYHELRKHKGISEQMAHDALEDVSYFGT
jgi:phosphate acetyltransferase